MRPRKSIPEYAQVALTEDLPARGLKAGDVGTVVMVHNGGEGFEVEFCTLTGETIDVVTLHAPQVRLIGQREIPNARRLAG
jgi:hypothetical protein